MIKRFNICTRKTYQKDGEEKVQWLRVGNLTHFPANPERDMAEGHKLELYMFPNTQLYIFEDRQRENGEQVIDIETGEKAPPAKPQRQKSIPAVVMPGEKKVDPNQIEYPTDEINPDEIPF